MVGICGGMGKGSHSFLASCKSMGSAAGMSRWKLEGAPKEFAGFLVGGGRRLNDS